MAKEDLLANLLVNLTTNESNSAQTDDNTLIQKMIAPNDNTQIVDILPTLNKLNPANFKWGGIYNIEWGEIYNIEWVDISNTWSSYNETWNQLINRQITANWLWNQGQWK